MSRALDVRRFHLRSTGMARVLGPTESEIMEAVWRRDSPVTIREVCEALNCRRSIAFNTVMTIMNRLVAKGLLRRTGRRASYRFEAAVSREDLAARVSWDVTSGLVEEFGALAVDQFVEAASRTDPSYLDRLEARIRERRQQLS